MEIQTKFLTTFSPAHLGDQTFLHRDVHLHLADSAGNIVSRGPIAQDNHRPLYGQTQLTDFTFEKKLGSW